MKTISFNVYPIADHPAPEKVFDWIRNNWHDLNEHSVEEVVHSIKSLNVIIGGSYDYCFGASPDRGEYIRFTDYDKDALQALDYKELPLTGVCWDFDLLTGFRAGNPERVLKALHDETEYQYSDAALRETCEANGYHFTETGEFYPEA